MGGMLSNPLAPQARPDGSFDPSRVALYMVTSAKTKYEPQEFAAKYAGSRPVLVVCTDDGKMEMANGKVFNSGNHPVEMFVPMLHFQDAGFDFDIATVNGGAVVLEEWAFPRDDDSVKKLHERLQDKLKAPKKLSDIPSLENYAAVFIPGGHGSMVNLPFSPDLGRLLREAHETGKPTVTLCHGPAALLSTKKGSADQSEGELEFAYRGYKATCFTDRTDGITPSLGYLPGQMPWKCQSALEAEGMKMINSAETGDVFRDRELITGDSPYAAHDLGMRAAPLLVKYALDNKL
eukprot:CAMPEP_0185834212 /NCGR_PEP_ID=MMETSP1353-20130828/4726_1 /TAXON_ID=1077150 /ORGANISM="Erythrolobus australicus, Strain CCMP3124" /LENGTH=291 /DNA_ID=CAMNT_0028532603 /DNA_START=113 /DNA_END=988 /DNA_ORIENTATION=+